MNIIEVKGNIEIFTADALVYSTNQYLHLSGGVGESLVKKYGVEVQSILDEYLSKQSVSEVEVGTIIEGGTANMPWKRVFHTVATNKEYETKETVVRTLISHILEECEIDFSISSIAFSALGSGFGSLTYERFIEILRTELVKYKNCSAFKVYVVTN